MWIYGEPKCACVCVCVCVWVGGWGVGYPSKIDFPCALYKGFAKAGS